MNKSHESGLEKGVITKEVFSLEESLLNSLESLENGRTFLCFAQSGESGTL